MPFLDERVAPIVSAPHRRTRQIVQNRAATPYQKGTIYAKANRKFFTHADVPRPRRVLGVRRKQCRRANLG